MTDQSNPQIAIGIASYREDQWEQWRSDCDDPAFTQTYDAWLIDAQQRVIEMREEGRDPQMVTLEFE